MLEAKSNLSRLVEAVAIAAKPAGKRVGVAKGRFTVPEDIDADAASIAALFTGRAE